MAGRGGGRGDRQIRVGVLVSSLKGGGAERQAALWAATCAAGGHDVTVLALRRREHEFELPPGVVVEDAAKSGRFDLVRVGRRIRHVAREVDVLVAFQPYCALLCALARVDRPVLAVTGEDPRRFGDTSRVPRRALRAGLERATLRTAPTAGLIECHRELGLAADAEWLLVPNIVDEQAFTATDRPRRGALFVGRLVPEKDPLLAVAVARAAGVPLALLGDGPLRDQIESAGAAGVSLLGYASQPWDTYAGAQACLVTSRYEAFGNMIVESLAAGTPVVAADCDFGPREVLAGARFSRVVPRRQSELAEALEQVLARPVDAEVAGECVEIAARYRADRVAPLIERALKTTVETDLAHR